MRGMRRNSDRRRTSGQAHDEVVLRLALPVTDATALARRLGRHRRLASSPRQRQQLRGIYFDTPDQALRKQQCALWLQAEGPAAQRRWQQVLEVERAGSAVLGRRQRWCTAASAPVPAAMAGAPWRTLDPDGSLFEALEPGGAFGLRRSRWELALGGGGTLAVQLDLGHVDCEGQRFALAQVELAAAPQDRAAVFELARDLARTLPMLPEDRSLAQRRPDLRHATEQARYARPPQLRPGDALADSAQRVLAEMYWHFSANLQALRSSDDAEVVHQARVGWRRFRAAWRLFRPALPGHTRPPPWQGLDGLFAGLGMLRDLDVACTETLPRHAQDYARGDMRRAGRWQALQAALVDAARRQRQAVRLALQQPAVMADLLAIAQWLEELLRAPARTRPHDPPKLRRWARTRLRRLHKRLEQALARGRDDAEQQHRARILAKRMRYGIEVLSPLLPRAQAQDWYRQAATLQASLGSQRDLRQAAQLAVRLGAPRSVAAFLDGLAEARRAA
jgi:inorganic triphosphatase YgiF